jgi:hypothetical protein
MTTKKNPPKRPEPEQRKMDVARKKFEKSHKPASGSIDSFSDELGRAFITGGRGFGVKGGSGISKGYTKGQGAPDRKQNTLGAIRAKAPAKTDTSFIRKAKVKKSIVKK